MVGSSARREAYLQIDEQVSFSYFFSTLVALNILILYELFRNYESFLHVPIWVLAILGAHPFFGSNCPRNERAYLTLADTEKGSLTFPDFHAHVETLLRIYQQNLVL